MSNCISRTAWLGALLVAATLPAIAQDAPRKPGPTVLKAAVGGKRAPRALKSMKVDLAKLGAFKGSPLTAKELAAGVLKTRPASEQLAALANMTDRYGKVGILAPAKPVQGTAANGVQYTMARTSPPQPRTSAGTTTTERGKDDFVVCKTTPMSLAKEFAGPLLVAGLPSSQNQGVIRPGALFRDADVVRGVYTPVMLPRRQGSLLHDVYNPGGPVTVDVANLNDASQVATAINALRSSADQAETNAYIEYTEATFRASSQLNLEMEGSMEANLDATIVGGALSPSVGAGSSSAATLGFEQNVNIAIANLTHVAYTISVGGEGPSSTIEGTIPRDTLCITDVQYGRRAFLMAGSFSSRAEASLMLTELVSASFAGNDVATASAGLSAETRKALELGFIRMTVVGGNTQQAVQVRDLATLRGYIEQLDSTVGGFGAVPLSYTLRYASDNAPAKVVALAEFTDKECFRAKQVKVTLQTIKPTKVVDFGDEELFGHIKVVESGNLANGSRTLWSKSESNAVSGKQGVAINVNESGTFNFNTAVSSDDQVEVEIELNDRIMGGLDPEWAGANAADRDRGYAKYERKTARVALDEIARTADGRLTKVVAVEEGDARVEIKLTYELIGP